MPDDIATQAVIPDRRASLIERLHGRECAHRAKGNLFDAELLKEAREAASAVDVLRDFMENPEFHVAVGGNPIKVDALLERARAALTKARQS